MQQKQIDQKLEKKVNELEKKLTEARKREEVMKENIEEYRQLFENESDAVMVFDAETLKFEDANRATLNLYGYSKEDFLALNVEDISAEKEKTKIAVQKIKDGEPDSENVVFRYFRKKGGAVFPGEICAGTFISSGRKKIIGAVRDITERKRAEEALRESEEKYRHIFENIQDVYYEVTLDGIILEVSPSIEESYAYKREALKGKSLYDIYADPKKRDEFIGVLLENEKVTDYEIILKDKNGSAVNCSITARLLRDEKGNPQEIVGTMRDITKRKRMEEELRESEEILKAILAVCPVGVGLVCNRTLDWANAAMYRILGYEEGSLLGEDARGLYLDDEECNRVGRELYPGMDETGIGQVDTRWIRKEGGVIDCHLQANPLDPNDPGKGHIVAAMDITDRKRAEEHIHALTQRLIKAQENERQRISLYLHDDVAQNLSTLKIGLETIFDDQPTPPRELTQRVSKFSQILQTAISAVRDLAYDQRPPSLDQLGLVQAVFQYCESFSEKYGLRVDFHSAGMDE